MANVMNKTPKGTISGWRWDKGVSVGLYASGKGSKTLVSIEYNEENDQLEIVLFDKQIKKDKVVIKHENE